MLKWKLVRSYSCQVILMRISHYTYYFLIISRQEQTTQTTDRPFQSETQRKERQKKEKCWKGKTFIPCRRMRHFCNSSHDNRYHNGCQLKQQSWSAESDRGAAMKQMQMRMTMMILLLLMLMVMLTLLMMIIQTYNDNHVPTKGKKTEIIWTAV